MCIRTNVDINDKLLKEVMKLLGAKTKKEAIDMALKETLRIEKTKEAAKSEGIGWGWDEHLDEQKADKEKSKKDNEKRKKDAF